MSAWEEEQRANWAGNLVYSAKKLVVPQTVEQAQKAVRTADKVRVVGSRHCFNDIADTTGIHLSLERLNRVLLLDKSKSRVTIDGGIRYGELGPCLHEQGYALHNMASLPHISIAGACATATHGSGALGNLAVAVAEIEFIDGRGDLVTLSREADGDLFAGAAVNLGALGAVTKLTLDLQPAFHVRQDIFRELPLTALESHFDEIMSSGYSVSLFTTWQTDAIDQVWVKSTVELDGVFAVRESLHGARPAAENLHPIASLDATCCTEQMGVVGPAYDRLPHFRMGFTPSSGDELQAEYFVPREYASSVIRTLSRQCDRLASLLLVSEIRTISADDLWMSPCYGTPCVAFHFTFRRDWPALKALLPGIEEALAPFHPRPHWGKMFTMAPEKIQACYPRLADFRELLDTHDPHGKFRNAFIERNIF